MRQDIHGSCRLASAVEPSILCIQQADAQNRPGSGLPKAGSVLAAIRRWPAHCQRGPDSQASGNLLREKSTPPAGRGQEGPGAANHSAASRLRPAPPGIRPLDHWIAAEAQRQARPGKRGSISACLLLCLPVLPALRLPFDLPSSRPTSPPHHPSPAPSPRAASISNRLPGAPHPARDAIRRRPAR